MSQTIEVESIRRLDIKPGEILVARVPSDTTQDVAHRIQSVLTDVVPADVQVVITNADVDLSVLSCPPNPASPAAG